MIKFFENTNENSYIQRFLDRNFIHGVIIPACCSGWIRTPWHARFFKTLRSSRHILDSDIRYEKFAKGTCKVYEVYAGSPIWSYMKVLAFPARESVFDISQYDWIRKGLTACSTSVRVTCRKNTNLCLPLDALGPGLDPGILKKIIVETLSDDEQGPNFHIISYGLGKQG